MSGRDFRERIRGGWKQAAHAIARHAVSLDLALEVRYEVDVLPTREDVVRRMPQLRAAYNEIALAREAVDKQVSMIGGHDPRLSAPGLPRVLEDKLRRQLGAMSIRHWVSQTTRDAEVCGNGYLVTRADPEPEFYALRPDEVEILANQKYRVLAPGANATLGLTDHVVHLRGIEQFESPYGISVLEPILGVYRNQIAFTESATFARYVIDHYSRESREYQWAEQTLKLSTKQLEEIDETIGKLLWFPREWLPDAREGLYFPGQERM